MDKEDSRMTKMLKIAGNSQFYPDSPSYLDEELRWVRTRVSRILAERQLQGAMEEETDGDPAYTHRPGRLDSRELRCRVFELKETEKKLRNEINARLDLNRTQRGAPPLGLDEICKEFDLSAEERIVLVTCLPLAISQRVAEMTLGEMLHHWGSIAVSDLVAVLDPQGLGDWLRYRALFRPHSPLISHGLVTLGKPGGEVQPSTLMCSDVSLSLDCFARMVGDPDTMTEAD